MIRTKLELTATAALAVMVAAPALAASTRPIVLAPHRAVYDMTLERTGASSGIAALTGRMVFELAGSACAGYIQSMRFVTQTLDPTGKTSISDQRSVFHEDAAKDRFRFETDQYRNDRLSSKSRGTATRSAAPRALKIAIAEPKPKTLEVARPVLFPVEHSVRLLEAAEAGSRLFSADLYDGSDKGEKVYATTAALGNKMAAGVNAALPKAAGGDRLDRLAAWPIALSYFEVGGKKRDAAPSYELSFLYFENGVSRRLSIDYGTFAMRGVMTTLTMLPAKPCP